MLLPATDWRRAAAAALFGLGLCLAAASATGAAPVAAPPHIARDVPQARLAGQGAFTWFGLSIYQAELWVGAAGYQPAAPEAAPFALDLTYARALDGRKIAAASAEQMEKIGVGTAAQRLSWLRTMEGIFPDVKPGTRLSGIYLPGAGLRFYLDGVLLADLPDAAFARAFFAIWLAPATSAPGLRAALLRDAAPLIPR